MIFLLVCLFSGLTHASDMFQGLSQGTAPTVELRRNPIPPKLEGRIVTFIPDESQPLRSVTPATMTSEHFLAHRDMPKFENFASLSIVSDKLDPRRDVNGGTCFGISYFAHMWHRRIMLPALRGETPILFKNGNHQVDILDQVLGRDSELTGMAWEDGVSYVVMEDIQAKQTHGGNSRFLPASFRGAPESVSLRATSKSDLADLLMIGMIAHHSDQQLAEPVNLNHHNAADTDQAFRNFRRLLAEHGSLIFYFHRFLNQNRFGTWRKWAWGHAVLAYRISEVMVEGYTRDDSIFMNEVKDSRRRAYKIHLADPNLTQTSPEEDSDVEGSGMYVLYFPDARQWTFSRAMQAKYVTKSKDSSGNVTHEPLMTSSSTVDNSEVVIGYFNLWEGHPVQSQVSRRRFLDGRVGQGRRISMSQARELKPDSLSPGQTESTLIMNE